MTMIKLEWKWNKGAGKFQAIKGNYQAEVRQDYSTRTWRALLYLDNELLADLPAPSAAAGKKIIVEKLRQIMHITLWDEL
jgi:hypothetical protein